MHKTIADAQMPEAMTDDFDQWFDARYPNREDRQGEFRMTSVRDLMKEAWSIAFGAGCVHGSERLRAVQGEPFGYFRAEPFGWTDCAETDEGAIALYTHPAVVPEDVQQAFDLLALLFSAYENGTDCYESPEDQAGYLGRAFVLGDRAAVMCANLLNKHRPITAAQAQEGGKP